MPRKPKFRPTITRIKLNPEQAVLTCQCHTGSTMAYGRVISNPPTLMTVCTVMWGKDLHTTYLHQKSVNWWDSDQHYHQAAGASSS